ncbi:MAG: S41 family peptidase [Bacteroidota bacterium]
MYLLKKVVLLACLCSPVTLCIAQADAYRPQKIPADALHTDFRLLRDTLQKIHPGIYRYQTKPMMDKLFDSCYASIHDSMTVTQFFMLTNFAIAAMKDGHSNSKMPRPVINEVISHEKILPAMVMFINNRVFVYCCNQDTTLTGAELLTINGHTIEQIVQRLFTYIPSDAGITSRKNWEINESFPLLYNLVYGNAAEFNITYKSSIGKTGSTTLKADVFKNINCPPPFQRPARYLQLGYPSNGVAVLTVQTFFNGFLQQTGEEFGRFMDSAFDDLRDKKVQKLLIDIRGNQGGNDGNGALLYAYLTSKPFMYYSSLETVNGQLLAADDHANLKLQQPRPNNFTGKVFVLANGRSFSASAEFSAIARSEKRAVFIGEEVGGGYFGNTSGNEANVVLPNSQLTCRVPLVKYTSAVKQDANKGNSVMPDYPVYPTIQDFIRHTDSQLLKALAIAGKN